MKIHELVTKLQAIVAKVDDYDGKLTAHVGQVHDLQRKLRNALNEASALPPNMDYPGSVEVVNKLNTIAEYGVDGNEHVTAGPVQFGSDGVPVSIPVRIIRPS